MRNIAVSMDNPEGELIFGSNDPSSPLEPRGELFNACAWATNVAKVAEERGQSFHRAGLCFQNLSVFGYSTPTDLQKDVGNVWLALPGIARHLFSSTAGQTRMDVLQQFGDLIRPGEMCVALGPPGSGCSTFLKTIPGETNASTSTSVRISNDEGISANYMHTVRRGDAVYTTEVDAHFPMLTVGETLTFVARARCQEELLQGIARNQ